MQYNFRFAAGKEFKNKFERLAEVLGVENPLQHMAQILEQAVDLALDKKDLQRKLERRKQRQVKQSRETCHEESRPDEILEKVPAESRYISSEARERLHERADYQCEYRAFDGTRCRARTGLEVEHERPFAIYRSHEERFLKVFCRQHNRFRAEQVYGAKLVQARIDESRRKRARSQ